MSVSNPLLCCAARAVRWSLLLGLALAAAGCEFWEGSSGAGPTPSPAAAHSVGGALSGLAPGGQLTLLNQTGQVSSLSSLSARPERGGDSAADGPWLAPRAASPEAMTLTRDGPFTFGTRVAHDGAYAVTVGSQPAGQVCTVGNATGSGVTSDVTSISVVCSATAYPIGGSVSGLGPGQQLTLLDNAADPLVVSANGAFQFGTPVAHGASYNVTVGAQPTGQTCTVTHGAGAGVQADVADVSVSCSSTTYLVGGSVSGLAGGQQVTLLDNGGDPLTVKSNGAFQFPSPLAYGGRYVVTIGTQPAGQTCSVANGTGPGTGGDVGNVAVTCSTTTYNIGGTLSGLGSGQQVTLLDNSGDPLTLGANGSFRFSTPVPWGGSYSVSVGTQPVAQVCTVSQGSGGPVGADVTTVAVNCTAHFAYVSNSGADSLNQYTIDSNGQLAPMSPAGISTPSSPAGIALDASGQYLYVASTYGPGVAPYGIGASGALTALSPSLVPAGTQPFGATADPKAPYLYVTNNGGASLSQFAIGGGGALSNLSPPSLTTPNGPYELRVDPTGQYLYMSNNGASSLSQFVIGAGGTLTPMSPATVAAGAYPVGLTVSPAGHAVYVALLGANAVAQYSVGAGGSLVPMSPATVAAGTMPMSVAVDRSGRYAYVANYGDGSNPSTVSQYTISSSGGLVPMSVPTVAAGVGPRFTAVDPTGRFVYVTHYGDATVRQYAIGSTGALTPLSPAAVPAGTGAWGIVVR